MSIPIRQTIKELTLTALHEETGLPISTLHRWMTEDRIPGKGVAHEWRVSQFEAAVEKLRRERPATRDEAA